MAGKTPVSGFGGVIRARTCGVNEAGVNEVQGRGFPLGQFRLTCPLLIGEFSWRALSHSQLG